MKTCILMGSPRKNGNTASLLEPFMETMKQEGAFSELIWLHDQELNPCRACRACQKDWTIFGCPQQDDMREVFDSVNSCELLVLATPIYSWYCTAPMKVALDRLMYGMNKFYGESKGPSLWKGKCLALITTCGYPPDKGADLWEEGIKRYCQHSQMRYLGMLVERHRGYKTVFMDEEKAGNAREFARYLCTQAVSEPEISWI